MKREIAAFIKKNYLIFLSCKFIYSLRFFIALLFLVCIYIASGHFSDKATTLYLDGYSISYFLFIATGIIYSAYTLAVLTEFSIKISEERKAGTLEAILVNPAGVTKIMFSIYVWSFIFVFVGTMPVLLFVIYTLWDALLGSDICALIGIFLLSMAAFTGLGMLLASFVLVFERGSFLVQLVNYCLRILGGIYIPFSFLPKDLRIISYFLPSTFGVRAFRKILFGKSSLANIMPEIMALLLFSAIVWPLAVIVLKFTLKKAREKGILSAY
ncbi:ABC transporter permease [bacterium]|nr:ABC transporter permease [bacterium]